MTKEESMGPPLGWKLRTSPSPPSPPYPCGLCLVYLHLACRAAFKKAVWH